MSDTESEYGLRRSNTEFRRRIALLEENLLAKECTAAAFQDSEKRYRHLFESARDGMLLLNAETGRVVDVNPFLLRLLGYSSDAFVGQPIWEIAVFKAIASTPDDFKALKSSEPVCYDELQLVHCNGQSIVVEFISSACQIDENSLIHCTIRDITDHFRLSAQLQQVRKMEAVGLLVSGVAHDYNNMLTVIIGYAELALCKAEQAQLLHAELGEILKAAHQSKEITRQLLTFVHKQTDIPLVLDLNQSVESMLKMLRRLVGEEITLDWLPEAGVCPVKMDPVQVNQILVNLCANARDAIADVGTVTIETGSVFVDEIGANQHGGAAAGKYVLLTVSDNGCGMGKDVIGQIFEPFFTSKGTGLGLATVHGIITQNNGFTNVSSEPGQGTAFSIYLPRHGEQTPAAWTGKAPELPLGCGETVLVVEDEPALLRIAQAMLEESGYHVLAAGTPGEAIRLAEAHAGGIDLLVTDAVMPEMNGLDLAKWLHFFHPEMKALFVSGYSVNVMFYRGVLADGVNFIQKPFSMQELAVKVRQVLQSG